MISIDDNKYYTIDDLQTGLGLSRTTVWRRLKEIPTITLEGKRIVSGKDLRAYLESNKREPRIK